MFYIFRYFHLLYSMGIKKVFSRLIDVFRKDKKKNEVELMLEQLGILEVNKG